MLTSSDERQRIKTDSSTDTIIKKCRICFQTERVPVVPEKGRKEEDTKDDDRKKSSLVKGKEPPPPLTPLLSPSTGSILKGFKRLLMSKDYKVQQDDLDDGFVSPCKCTGSMAWVHKKCLGIWRNKSPRRDSFYQCEQCFTPYCFRHTTLTTLLANPFSIKVLSGLTLGFFFFLSVLVLHLFIPARPLDFNPIPGTVSEEFNTNLEGSFTLDGTFSATQPRVTTRTVQPKRPAVASGVRIMPTPPPKQQQQETPREGGTYKQFKRQPPPSQSNNDHSPSPHSPISYLNVGYWITGHSIDEGEDAKNDFLAAVLDHGMVEVWPAAIAFLACIALIKEGTQSSCLAATLLIVATMAMYFVDWIWSIWIYPVPAAYGLARFAKSTGELVERSVDTFIKWTSSELDDLR